jgi:polyhydroxybutyrate depolymerase
MPGWVDRAFDVVVPDRAGPLPVVIAFHGGAGNRRAAASVTCPGGDLDDPACLTALAAREGFVLVRPDGTGTRPFRNFRTWNAGGGEAGWNCTSGPACRAGVDDVRYVRALLDEVARLVPVDPGRVYATGLSNGGAMSHRVACELSDRVVAIAAVGGTNQLQTAAACAGSLPILQIHGTLDPCWTYVQSDDTCVSDDDAGTKLGVAESMEGWRLRNGCGAATIEAALPDLDPGDGTTTTRIRWQGCAQDVELLRVDGGGHSWPGGFSYLGEDRIGRVARDFDGSEAIWAFFEAHAR